MLKSVPNTKIIALGIGDGVDIDELNYMATDPDSDNVILVEDYSKLDEVDQQLRDVSCTGQLSPVFLLIIINNCLLMR